MRRSCVRSFVSFCVLAIVALGHPAASQEGSRGSTPELRGPYLGQPVPGLQPLLFAPGLVSTDGAVELNGVVSPDGRELFFTRMTRSPEGEQIFRMHHSRQDADGSWSAPKHLPVYPNDAPSLAVDMAYSPDGQRLYFLGRHVHELSPREPGADLWFSERNENGDWGLASPVAPPVWSEHTESYPSFAPDGSLQFSSNRPGGLGDGDLWRAAPADGGEFQEPVNLGPPVNTVHRESDSCVAPDGSYIVFTSDRPGGFGGGDLWVSFRDPETGSWSEPKNLGAEVNGSDTDYCPMVTPDGRYLFFSRRISDPADSGWEGVVGGNVYWVDTAVIETLR